jgi:hypothetical protein
VSVNWDRLKELSGELNELREGGRLTKAEYDRIVADAEVAVDGDTELLEPFTMWNPEPDPDTDSP